MGNTAAGYTLHATTDTLASAIVRLNGKEVLGAGDFLGAPRSLVRPVLLDRNNEIWVWG